ncbi:MAG: hypothetical protein MJZ68_01550 [archaeon]|nr:hypothetical protein [archaeon]
MVGLSGLRGLLKVSKVAKVGTSAAKTSKLATFIGELPIIRLAAGSAVGVTIIDTWNKSVNSMSKMLGVDDETSSLLLGIAVVVCVSMVFSAIISVRRRRY